MSKLSVTLSVPQYDRRGRRQDGLVNEPVLTPDGAYVDNLDALLDDAVGISVKGDSATDVAAAASSYAEALGLPVPVSPTPTAFADGGFWFFVAKAPKSQAPVQAPKRA